jgi:hypothetical protein
MTFPTPVRKDGRVWMIVEGQREPDGMKAELPDVRLVPPSAADSSAEPQRVAEAGLVDEERPADR